MLIDFDVQFDGTHMTPDEISREARERGWPGIRLDADEIHRTDTVIVRRMTKRDAYSE